MPPLCNDKVTFSTSKLSVSLVFFSTKQSLPDQWFNFLFHVDVLRAGFIRELEVYVESERTIMFKSKMHGTEQTFLRD